jgi:uncharacterized membrane protein YeaQ/YmgE (transglycosylase-associated protein family)
VGTAIAVELRLQPVSAARRIRTIEDNASMLNFAVWLVVGALIGWVAGLLMRDDEDQGVFVNVLVGVAGALLAGWLIAPYLGVHVADPTVFNFAAMAVALVGAVALLTLMSLLRRKKRD